MTYYLPKTEKSFPKFIDWLQKSREIDAQWFQIVLDLIIKFKISIIYLIRMGFERLGGKKCEHILKKHSKDYLEVYKLVKVIVERIDPQYSLRSFGLKFLVQLKEKLIGSQQPEGQSIFINHMYLSMQEILLYRFVYKSKGAQWECKRRIRIFEDITQLQKVEQIIGFSEVEKAYQLVHQNYRHRLNFIHIKLLDDNFAKYRLCRNDLEKFIQKNKSKIFLNTRNSTKSRKISGDQEKLNQSLQIEILDSQSYGEQMRKVRESEFQKSFEQLPGIQKPPEFVDQYQIQKTEQIELHYSKITEIETAQQEIQSFIKIQTRLCCRPYFVKDQLLMPESRDIEYKNYALPWSQPLQYKVGKTICAFLNSNGGNIYIGIEQSEQFIRKVVGRKYTDSQKQDVFRNLRQIAQSIKPDILSNQLFDVNFVPVMSKSLSGEMDVIKNCYVIKISVKQGFQSKLYSIINRFTNSEEVCIRTWNEVISYKSMHEALSLLEDRMKNNVKIETLYPHKEPCDNEKMKLEFASILKLIKKPKKQLKTNTRIQSTTINQSIKIQNPKILTIRQDNIERNQSNGGVIVNLLSLNQGLGTEAVGHQRLMQRKKCQKSYENNHVFDQARTQQERNKKMYQNVYPRFPLQSYKPSFEGQSSLKIASIQQHPSWLQEKHGGY